MHGAQSTGTMLRLHSQLSLGLGTPFPFVVHMGLSMYLMYLALFVCVLNKGNSGCLSKDYSSSFKHHQSVSASTSQQITVFPIAEKQLSLNYFLRVYQNDPIKILSQGSKNTTSENISGLFMSQK